MRTRESFLIITLFLTAFAAAGAQEKAPKAQAPNNSQNAPKAPQAQEAESPYVQRFKELDRNQDGFVSQAEWPLSAESFKVVDRNSDGRLSGSELLSPNVPQREDRGPLIVPPQRPRQPAGPVVLPRTPTLEERREGTWRPGATAQDQRSFRLLDRNNDNRLTRPEWTARGPLFDRVDRNRDGVISPNEWPRR